MASASAIRQRVMKERVYFKDAVNYFLLRLCSVCGERLWSTDEKILKGENRRAGRKPLSQGHFFHQKFHMKWSGVETGPPR
jgi:hypothetical protein